MALPKIAELRKMTDADLIAAHDQVAFNTGSGGVTYYLDELARREQSRQTEAMLKYTWWITVLTAIVVVATIVDVVLACLRH